MSVTVVAAAVPIGVGLAVGIVSAGVDSLTHLTLAQRTAVASNTLLVEALLVAVFAPLVGLVARRWLTLATVFTLSSCGVIFLIHGTAGSGGGSILRGHAMLFAVAVVGQALGLCGRVVFRRELDAAAAALVVAWVLTFDILLIGPTIGPLPTRAVDAMLAANPVIAIAAAADIDLLRSDLFYRLSPVAHRRFEYPTWTTTFFGYGVSAGLALAIAATGGRRRETT
jgi:hypothetical protein